LLIIVLQKVNIYNILIYVDFSGKYNFTTMKKMIILDWLNCGPRN
jgi:hypothetical protein